MVEKDETLNKVKIAKKKGFYKIYYITTISIYYRYVYISLHMQFQKVVIG